MPLTNLTLANPFSFTPVATTEPFREDRQIPDAVAGCNRLDVPNLADDFELHARNVPQLHLS